MSDTPTPTRSQAADAAPTVVDSPDGDAFGDLVAANARYAAKFDMQGFDGIARSGVAIVTCMDSRIDPLGMVGLVPGDAKIFRNPGGRVTDAALEALVLGVHLLNVQRILVIPHTRCAMSSSTEAELHEKVSKSAGQDSTWQTFNVITDPEGVLREDVHRVNSHPLISGRAQVAGFFYDVDTGLINRVC